MRPGIEQIVGRRISGVVVKGDANVTPKMVFLLFDDGTAYEFYGSIGTTSGIRQGGAAFAREYLAESHPVIFEHLLASDGGR